MPFSILYMYVNCKNLVSLGSFVLTLINVKAIAAVCIVNDFFLLTVNYNYVFV